MAWVGTRAMGFPTGQDKTMVIFVLTFAALSALVAAMVIALVAVAGCQQPEAPAAGERRPEEPIDRSPETHCTMVALTDKDRDGFLHVWDSVCSRFSTDPRKAVCYADLLMSDIVGDPLHGGLRSAEMDRETSEKYRLAHEIAIRNKQQDLNPGELALAMSLYIAVFAEVLSEQDHSYGMNVQRETSGMNRL